MDLPAQHSGTEMAPLKESLAHSHSHLGFIHACPPPPQSLCHGNQHHFLLDTQLQDLWTCLSRAGTLSWSQVFHASAWEKAAWCSQPTDVPTVTSDHSQEVNMTEYIHGAWKKKTLAFKVKMKKKQHYVHKCCFLSLVSSFLLSIES